MGAVKLGSLLALPLLVPAPLMSGPWLEAGDIGLRSDIQALADAGVIHAPMMSWPLAWSDISKDLGHNADLNHLDPYYQHIFQRVRKRYQRASDDRFLQAQAQLSVGAKVSGFRTFEGTPREDNELSASVEWLGDFTAVKINVSVVDNAQDGRQVRLDGSYLGMVLGNWSLSLNSLNRWWGPGYSDSLILSSNARPIPTVTVQRLNSDPFDFPILNWLGPWQLSASIGRMEEDRAIADPLFLAIRFNFKPTDNFELGISRTAQFAGAGRPSDFSTFFDLLIGKDNSGSDGVTRQNEPGNQLAAIDFRWAQPFAVAPVAIYGQMAFEDEAGGLPSRPIAQFGAETWGHWFNHHYRVYLEIEDTAVDGLFGDPRFNFAFEHGVYLSGYRYRGRSIASTLDNDSRAVVIGAIINEDDYQKGATWHALGRYMQLNRDNSNVPGQGGNQVTDGAQDVFEFSVTRQQKIWGGTLKLGVNFNTIKDERSGGRDEDGGLFVQWSQQF